MTSARVNGVCGRGVVLAAAAAALLVGASPAAASYIDDTAVYSASLSGTYTTSGMVSRTDCINPPTTRTVNVSDRVSFSTKLTKVQITYAGDIFGGTVRGKRMTISVTDDRSSGLDGDGGMPGCIPNDDFNDRPAMCGSRNANYRGDIQAALHGNGLGFVFLQRGSVVMPPDIFDACPMGDAQTWFGQLPYLSGPAGPARIFNRHRRTIVIRAHRSGTKTAGDGSTGTFREQFTLTLHRLSRIRVAV
ncbi:MAG TPA: hypothetical protein VGF74_05775 [Thermoleophilaceae bacterium]